MKIIFLIQLVLYCLIFTGMVKLAVRDNPLNGLYFYPKPIREHAYEIGLADRDTVHKKKTRFMTAFYLVMLITLIVIIRFWNGVTDFKTAYFQALCFLQVMNWYDGIIIDKIWVGYSKFWILPGMDGIPFVQTWKQILKKRIILSLIWIVGAVLVALLVLVF